MTIRTKRRVQTGATLETMSDHDLKQIYFFGSIAVNPTTMLYTATPEEQDRAGEILRQRARGKQ